MDPWFSALQTDPQYTHELKQGQEQGQEQEQETIKVANIDMLIRRQMFVVTDETGRLKCSLAKHTMVKSMKLTCLQMLTLSHLSSTPSSADGRSFFALVWVLDPNLPNPSSSMSDHDPPPHMDPIPPVVPQMASSSQPRTPAAPIANPPQQPAMDPAFQAAMMALFHNHDASNERQLTSGSTTNATPCCPQILCQDT